MSSGNIPDGLMFPIKEASMFPWLFFWFGEFFPLINKKLSILLYVLEKKITDLYVSEAVFTEDKNLIKKSFNT